MSMAARITAMLGHNDTVPTPVPAGTATLRATGVSVERRGRRVLDNVDFAVTTGEVVALVGPNGAGKSSLIAALAGEHRVSEGSVALDDQPLHNWTPIQMAQRRAVLPQSHTIGFAFTAEQVVRMGRSPWARTPRREDDDRLVHDAMAVCDVDDFADRPFLALSGGERARVALARVLAQDTQTVLLDEPTAALDLGHQETVMRLARARADAGAAVVVVLHDLGLAAAYAHRVAVLDGGRIAAMGSPREIFTEDLLSRVYGHPIEVLAHPETAAQLVIPKR